MSGIAALLSRREGAEAGAQVRAMMETMSHRGPDGRGIWAEGPVGVGHLLLATLPEAELAPQPLVRDGTVLVADCRIDNREELAREIGCPARAGDAELILLSYEKWGEASVRRLRGDFAFVLWDSSLRRFLCARDHFGVKPLFWCAGSGLFAAASEIKALLILGGVPRRLDKQMIANHLRSELNDPAVTYWQGIRRLPAAHTMLVCEDGVPRQRRYWSLDPHRQAERLSDAEHVDALRSAFIRAVSRRMRASRPVAAALSGGLDSSAVACTASTLTRTGGQHIHTFSLVFESLPEVDEWRWIEAALADRTLVPHTVAGDQLNPISLLDELTISQDGIFFAPNLYLHWGMYSEARSHGVGVFLDGFDGDSTINHGGRYPLELLVRGHPFTAYREVRALAARTDLSPWAITAWLARRTLVPSLPAIPRWRTRRAGQTESHGIISSHLAARNGRVGGLDQPSLPLRATNREAHFRQLSSPLQALVLEALDRAAAVHGIEPRYPFFDVELAELCLAMPGNQKLRDGYTRWVMRKAMEGILPPAIQWRTGKSNLAPVLMTALQRHAGEAMSDLLEAPGATTAYLDLGAVQGIWQRFLTQPTPDATMPLWLALTLHRGLATAASLGSRP